MRPRSNAAGTTGARRRTGGVHRKRHSIPALLLGTLGAGWVSCSTETSTGFEVVETTIAEVQAAIRDGTTTCRAVVERHLARIAAYEDLINAITVLNPRALQRAAEFDASLAADEEMGRRITGGVNPGRKSSKVIQDCTICVSCRWAVTDSIMSRQRERRNRLAGIHVTSLPPAANPLPERFVIAATPPLPVSRG